MNPDAKLALHFTEMQTTPNNQCFSALYFILADDNTDMQVSTLLSFQAPHFVTTRNHLRLNASFLAAAFQRGRIIKSELILEEI